MSDFEKKLEEKILESKRREAERDAERQRARSQSESITGEGVGLLKEHVLPILEEARGKLVKIGMDLLVKEDFDVAMYSPPVPSVSATVGSVARKSDNYRLKSVPLVIQVKDGELVIGRGSSSNDRRIDKDSQVVPPSDSRLVIEGQLLALTDEVLKEFEDRIGTWQ